MRPLRLAGGGAALSVDVEEWYHNCWVPEYVDPRLRRGLPEELDRLLPELLARFERLGARATFFVLGEVARRLPGRVREIVAAGHEVACHGDLHLRADDRSVARFREDVRRAKSCLEEVTGGEVVGFRAPEWSLRRLGNPRLRAVAELGFVYDSSLVPAPGAGGRGNPRTPARLVWPDGRDLVELPPLVWGGAMRLPAGGWCGRLAAPRRLQRAATEAERRGVLPLFVVHPWELADRPCPGLLTGFARFFHEAGRDGYGARFDELVRRSRFTATLGARCRTAPASDERAAREAARGTAGGFTGRAVEGVP